MAVSKRLMLFIDGENLVFRYQAMLKDGYYPYPYDKNRIIYKKDIYLWSSGINLPNPNDDYNNIDVVRAYYYTSVTGDKDKLNEIDEEIRNIRIGGLAYKSLSPTLYPITFKRDRPNEKAKGVDIRMTIDILSHTYNNNLDIACFFSGDGDFEPVLQEVSKHGKLIYIYSFSSGFNSNLKKVCDQYTNLDENFFDLTKSPSHN
jgi:uncharacterized protein (TIGR00288 family)